MLLRFRSRVLLSPPSRLLKSYNTLSRRSPHRSNARINRHDELCIVCVALIVIEKIIYQAMRSGIYGQWPLSVQTITVTIIVVCIPLLTIRTQWHFLATHSANGCSTKQTCPNHLVRTLIARYRLHVARATCAHFNCSIQVNARGALFENITNSFTGMANGPERLSRCLLHTFMR